MRGGKNDIGSPYFNYIELCCKGTGEFKLEDGFLKDLDHLRMVYGQPMVVTSCCRSSTHNEKIGGHPKSLHLINNPYWAVDTCAIDVKRPSGYNLYRLIRVAADQGWSIGIADNFIHLDRRTRCAGIPPTIYTY